jgi:hypothetical protein
MAVRLFFVSLLGERSWEIHTAVDILAFLRCYVELIVSYLRFGTAYLLRLQGPRFMDWLSI